MLRLIARIDVRNGFHVKTIGCEGVQKLRRVEESIEDFSVGENEHDEIILIDTVASLYGFENWLIRQSEIDHLFCPIPLAVGGAIRNVKDAEETIGRGADKVVVNTAAIHRPLLLAELADKFGRQAVVLQVDVGLIGEEYFCFSNGAREKSRYRVPELLKLAQELGAGEIHVTSISTEGSNKNFPEDLAEICKLATDLPIIVSGGIRSAEWIMHLFNNHDIDSFSFSSMTNVLDQSMSQIRAQLTELGGIVRCLS
jgi:cyclase